MKKGFVPALSTPIDANGKLIADSYAKEIERGIQAGAVALLSMGSMGQQAFLLPETCRETAEVAVKTAAGRVPVLVGTMDNSIARAKARIAALEDLDIFAFVLTTPYYEIDTKDQVLKYFEEVAGSTKHNIMLYDLVGVTQFKITLDMVERLHKSSPNFIGIKSADLVMLRKIRLNPEYKNFLTFYSGLDSFDVAYPWGVGNVLDGMCAVCPVNSQKLIEAMDNGNKSAAATALDNITGLRDLMLDCDLWPAYSYAQNLLGFEGNHCPDWCSDICDEYKAKIRKMMEQIGEL